jgi:hypothetical protein
MGARMLLITDPATVYPPCRRTRRRPAPRPRMEGISSAHPVRNLHCRWARVYLETEKSLRPDDYEHLRPTSRDATSRPTDDDEHIPRTSRDDTNDG